MIFLAYFVIGFLLLVFLVTLFNALTAPMLKNGPQNISDTFVSILIPARNESTNIEGCLESILKQTYPNFEVLVLDDNSTDDTLEIIQSIALKDKRVRFIKGQKLAPGWSGKNWACHQLSQQAQGDIFIFTDADNRYLENAVIKTVGWMDKLKLDLFSAFPQQYTLTLAEKLIIPSVYMTVYSYLPLWLTYYLPSPALAAANGQWIAFTKQAYHKIDGHQAAKAQIVEDTWLARYVKSKGMKTLTAAGTDAVYGRMYHNWSEIWQGFSKNLFGLMGYQATVFIFLLLLMFVSFISPYFFIFYSPVALFAGFAVLLNILIRVILALKYKDPFINILLHPFAILLTIIIGLNSMRMHNSGNLEWKGRKITTAQNDNV